MTRRAAVGVGLVAASGDLGAAVQLGRCILVVLDGSMPG